VSHTSLKVLIVYCDYVQKLYKHTELINTHNVQVCVRLYIYIYVCVCMYLRACTRPYVYERERERLRSCKMHPSGENCESTFQQALHGPWGNAHCGRLICLNSPTTLKQVWGCVYVGKKVKSM
jgi:hypothetical protein